MLVHLLKENVIKWKLQDKFIPKCNQYKVSLQFAIAACYSWLVSMLSKSTLK